MRWRLTTHFETSRILETWKRRLADLSYFRNCEKVKVSGDELERRPGNKELSKYGSRPLHLKWSAVQAWLEEKDQPRQEEEELISVARGYLNNYLIVSQEKSFRHAHNHLTAYEMTRRMAEAVSEGFRVSSSALEQFLKAREVKVVDPVEVIRKIAEERKFSQKFADETVSSYLAEPEPNLFGVINAFTRAAQGLALLQRIEMERFAGRLLESPIQ